MPGLGIDIGGVQDVDKFLNYADPPRACAERVMRSLLHKKGKLWWAPDSGYDINQHLHAFFDAEQIQRNVQTQCELEEGVKKAQVSASSFGGELKVVIHLILIDSNTPAELTVSIDQLGKVLNASVIV